MLLSLVSSPARAEAPVTVVIFGTPAETPTPVEPSLEPSPPPDEEELRPPPCPEPVTIIRRFEGKRERIRMPLLDCDQSPRPEALRALSVLARPRGRAAPTDDELRRWRRENGTSELLAHDIRLLDPGLLERLQRIGDAFRPHPIEIISGYRPDSPAGSRHHHGRALDLVVKGVSREALRDFALTLPQTGVGWYPNSVFVHVDVREVSAYWVDLSGPGERPRYVRGAQPPAPASRREPNPPSPIREALDRFRRETADALRALQVPAP